MNGPGYCVFCSNIFLAAIVPLFAKKLRLPVIVLELVIGIMLGKSMLNLIPEHAILEFFASFGLVYLMFLAGLEIDVRKIKKYFSETITLAVFSIIVPFLSGVIISPYVGVHPLFLGTIFSTTSLGIILPLVKELRGRKNYSQILLTSVLIVDILSMFLLAFSLSMIEGSLGWSYIYSLLAVLTLFVIPWLMERKGLLSKVGDWLSEKSHFDMEVRLSFALIFLLAAVTEHFGFHSIIGAFVAGLVISELTPKSSLLDKKLESFGYGFFIPLFFILMGSQVNLPVLFSNFGNIKILTLIIVVGLLSKIIGVSITAKFQGFNWRRSLSMGFFHSARLSLIIAAVEIGRRLGFINENLFSIFVLLAIVSALIGPSVGKYILGKKKVNRKVYFKRKKKN